MATADLRPMTLGEVLDHTFTLYRENFLLFVGIAAIPYLVVLIGRFLFLLSSRGTLRNPNNFSPGMLGGIILGALGAAAIWVILLGIAQAATIWAVSELYLGRSASVRAAYANSKDRIMTVIVIIILVFLATVITSGVTFFLLCIPGIYLACRLAVSVPVAMVENESSIASMERSMELTKGYGWQIFLLFLLTFVISWVVSMFLEFPATIFTVKAALAKQQPSLGVMAYSYVANFMSQVLVGPIGTISASLMYYNLRVRKEGFDIQHLMNSLGSVPRPLADPPGIQ